MLYHYINLDLNFHSNYIKNGLEMERIPVTLLTGFLGSGKSTLLTTLLEDSKFSDTAVVVNEFGEVGLDGILIEHNGDQIVEMTSGCLCCTIRGDIRDTLLALHGQRERNEIPWFKRLIVETTGLADPAPVIHTLISDPLLGRRYMLGGVVTTIDAINGTTTLDAHVECEKQVAVADRLVITKTDLIKEPISERELERLKRKLIELNPGAVILFRHAPAFDFYRLFDTSLYDPETKTTNVRKWLGSEAEGLEHNHHHHGHEFYGHTHEHRKKESGEEHAHDVTRHGTNIRSFTLTFEEPLEIEALASALEVLTLTHGANLLRLKGIVNTTERPGMPLIIHGVQHLFHTPVWLDEWPDENQQSRLVFITSGIERKTLEVYFESWISSYNGGLR